MINATELRIGNLVLTSTDTIVPIQASGINAIDIGMLIVKPIPLTEEILLKCGLTSNPDGYFRLTDETLYFDGYVYFENDNNSFHAISDISYLHQLQNLFYILTGQELNVDNL